MKLFFISLLVLMASSALCHADDATNVADVDLFTVNGSGKTIQYKARVTTPDCSFDPDKPTEIYMVESDDKERKISWIESKYLDFEYIEKETKKIIAEVKYFKDNNIHLPVALTVGMDKDGQCKGSAVETDSGTTIQVVDVTQSDEKDAPKQIVITGEAGGQSVQLPVTINN